MSQMILRLSTLQFDDEADLELGDEPVDGASALPLIAYELMLPLIEACDDEAMPILFSIESDSGDARRIAG